MNEWGLSGCAIRAVRCEAVELSDARPAGWWTSEDGQGALDMRGATLGRALAELLGQCSGAAERAGILAGTLEVLDEEGEDC